MERARAKGYFYGAVAAVSYGLNPLFALPMYRAGIGADSVLFYRYLIATVLLALLVRWRGQSLALRRAQIAPLAVLGLLVSFSSLFLFESYNRMDAGIASTILFVYPVMVAGLMAFFFRERITVVTGLSILLALSGISLLYKSESGATLSLTGVVLVFLSALCYAVYVVAVNRSSLKDMPAEKLTFYVLLFGCSVYIVRTRFGVDLQPLSEPSLWLNAFALGLFPTVVSFVAMAVAIRCIGSTPSAILGALEPVTALFFGVMVFGEQFTFRIATGVVLILAAVMLTVAGKPLVHRLPVLLHIRRSR